MRSTRDKLAIEAGFLFQQKGYHGVGLSEILKQAAVPKGSLYHHFPQGKADLALASAQIASEEMLRLIRASFSNASDYADGVTTLCHKLAKYVDIQGGKIGCPVSSTLLEGPDNDTFPAALTAIFDSWINAIATHAERFGQTPEQALHSAKLLFISVEGSWTLARSQRSSAPLRELPELLRQTL